jgi:hypothetical protein
MPFRYDPNHWRERAAQMGALAVDTTDAEAAGLMFKLADDYDKLADRAEQRAKRSPKKATPSQRINHPGKLTCRQSGMEGVQPHLA